MPVSLTKGGNVNLTKIAPSLSSVTVGLGWEPRTTTGKAFDLDASVLVCGANNKVLSDEHFIFYNNLRSPDGNVVHQGDERTGDTQGDDETVSVNLGGLGTDVQKIVFSVTIHDAEANGQNFGQVSDAYIRVIDDAGSSELARYDLSEDASTETAMVFGELYRNDGDWKFRAVGQGYVSGLVGIITDYGVSIG